MVQACRDLKGAALGFRKWKLLDGNVKRRQSSAEEWSYAVRFRSEETSMPSELDVRPLFFEGLRYTFRGSLQISYNLNSDRDIHVAP